MYFIEHYFSFCSSELKPVNTKWACCKLIHNWCPGICADCPGDAPMGSICRIWSRAGCCLPSSACRQTSCSTCPSPCRSAVNAVSLWSVCKVQVAFAGRSHSTSGVSATIKMRTRARFVCFLKWRLGAQDVAVVADQAPVAVLAQSLFTQNGIIWLC